MVMSRPKAVEAQYKLEDMFGYNVFILLRLERNETTSLQSSNIYLTSKPEDHIDRRSVARI